MRRALGIVVLLCSLLAAAGEVLSRVLSGPMEKVTVVFPTVSAIFRGDWAVRGWALQPWLGWCCAVAFAVLGLWLAWRPSFHWSPMMDRRWQRFRQIGRGWWSFRILVALVVVAGLDQVVAGRRALVVRHHGEYFFPAFRQEILKASQFGQLGEGEADYRLLREQFAAERQGDFAILPVIPWDATYDTDQSVRLVLEEVDGRLFDRAGKPFSGLAQRYHAQKPEVRVRQSRVRDGWLQGVEERFNEDGVMVRTGTWKEGRLVESKDLGVGGGVVLPEGPWVEIDYPPIAPNFARGHYLGSDSRGWDVAAQLYGGFQVVLKAAALYLGVTYLVGITIGLLMGFLGGIFDITAQRVIEVFSAIPFIYLVIILVSIFDRDRITLPFLVAVLCLFSWIGCCYYMRTATYREKARDYVAAARVLGAGHGRIIFRHILPNTLAILVTLVPFSVTGISSSLTGLDFIGFGLPQKYPSWGRLLADGVEYLRSAPWVVVSVFSVLVLVLLLVTFVGEALREAFDPKKFTTYR